ncbi:MAG TPA: winged helix-turn-helix domain-containing protein [Terriglobia bacterium]|nr:winged helix-turn-helix domain-containing protein [Terriglobia bacterium]
MSLSFEGLYRFDEFELRPSARAFLRSGKPILVSPKAFEVLTYLVINPGRVVTKDELLKAVWPDTFVEEGNLAQHISWLRKAMGDRSNYIVTVPGRGYQLAARVQVESPQDSLPQKQAGNILVQRISERTHVVIEESSSAPISVASPSDTRSSVFIPAINPQPGPVPSSARDLQVGTGTEPWRRAIFLAPVVLAVLAGWVWFSPLPQPTVLKITQITHFGRVSATSRLVTDGTRLYFSENRGGRYTLATIPVDGGEPVPVPTPFPNTALYGISPDHSELLVGSFAGGEGEQSLWTLRTTGGSPRRLGGVIGRDPAWSPDGQKIVYFSGSDLYEVKPDGSDSRKLVSDAGTGWLPRWSPDGQTVRFTAWGSAMPTLSLWEVSAAGSDLHRLLPGWGEAPTHYADGESGGDWTPDGKYFLFRSTRAGVASIWSISEKHNFFLRSPQAPVRLTPTDTSLLSLLATKTRIFYTGDKEVRELARFDARLKQFIPYLPGVRALDVSFSKDGQRVAYIVTTTQEAILWRSKADGSERQQLTFPPMVADAPRWSPDGKQIAFVGTVPGNQRRIFLVSSEGGSPEPVTALDSLYPDWSPRGDSLFFSAPVPASASMVEEKNFGTYQLDLNTRRLSVFPGAEALKASAWSPDGRYLVAQTRDDRSLMVFDSHSRQWSEFARGTVLRAPVFWSRDSKYAYSQDVSEGVSQPIFRVRLSDLKVERIATFEQILREDVRNYVLTGVAPDGSPLASLILSHSDVYALDINFP